MKRMERQWRSAGKVQALGIPKPVSMPQKLFPTYQSEVCQTKDSHELDSRGLEPAEDTLDWDDKDTDIALVAPEEVAAASSDDVAAEDGPDEPLAAVAADIH